MKATPKPRHSPVISMMLATIPMVLAAITVLMVRDALAADIGRTESPPALHISVMP